MGRLNDHTISGDLDPSPKVTMNVTKVEQISFVPEVEGKGNVDVIFTSSLFFDRMCEGWLVLVQLNFRAVKLVRKIILINLRLLIVLGGSCQISI